jgi:hypothetical protein
MTTQQLEEFERYLLSPEEIECRVAAARMNLTPEERRGNSPVAAMLADEAATRVFLSSLRTFLRSQNE